MAYLGLAITGMLSYGLIRGQLYVPGDAATTAANLAGHEALARLGIALDLVAVLTQSLAALYFFKLFRQVDAFAAGSLAAFGFMNAAAMLVSTMFTATALKVAVDGAAAGAGDPATTSGLLYNLSDAAWATGGLFFGLWLIPMGWLVLKSGYMPAPLGWALIVGGVGYVLTPFATYLAPQAPGIGTALQSLSIVGEFWMIGYLLAKGVRQRSAQAGQAPAVTLSPA